MDSDPKMEPELPLEMYLAARKTYNLQQIYLLIGDQLEEISSHIDQTRLNPSVRLNPEQAFRLAMVCGFQYAETMPDPTAAQALVKRMDWKYALHLPVHILGVRDADLSEFRKDLLVNQISLREFGHLLNHLGELGLFPRAASNSLTPLSTAITVCQITRFSQLNRVTKAAVALLSSSAPGWLLENVKPQLYGQLKTGKISLSFNRFAGEMQEEAVSLGIDIHAMVMALHRDNPLNLVERPEIQALENMWKEQFAVEGDQIAWRLGMCRQCGQSTEE